MSADRDASLKDRLLALLQLLLPTRFLSWCMYKLTRIKRPWFKDVFIRTFMRLYRISLVEAQLQRPESFPDFNAFFTRALKDGVRPLAGDSRTLVSPVDGTVSQLGTIREQRIFQAKGRDYSALELLGGDEHLARPFLDGGFCTIYLAPYNYHRIHMPLTGTLREWVYVPGRLFSVNQANARGMHRLFTRNERVAAIFDTEIGPLAVIMVGALFVGSMETVWAGMITPPHSRAGVASYQPMQAIRLERGAELGRFNMGSTVILLTPPGVLDWQQGLGPGSGLRVGEALAGLRA
jgi:phosphatidylserine decarboxylase